MKGPDRDISTMVREINVIHFARYDATIANMISRALPMFDKASRNNNRDEFVTGAS